MNEVTLTVVGNVASDVEVRMTGNGEAVASFRLATSVRRFDRTSGEWVDADTNFFTVSCWKSLGRNVAQTLTKGMPVVVHGRLRSREVERPCGDRLHRQRYQDIDAYAVGPDLTRGVAVFTRTKRDAVVAAEARAVDEALRASTAVAKVA